MTQGKSVYDLLYTAITVITQRLVTQQNKLAAARQEQTDLNKALSEDYKKLAEFYLAEMDANRLDKHFDRTATKVAALQDERDRKKAQNQIELKEVEDAIQSLETMHEKQVGDRDSAANAYELKMAESKKAFMQTDECQTLKSELQALLSRYEKASKRLEDAIADRDEKRKPYEADKIFAYLLKINYGTPNYEKKGIIRLCDGWLAEFVDYNQSHKNYQLLLAIPDRLADHVENLKADNDKVQETIDDCIEKEFSESGGLPLREQLDACEDRLQETIEKRSKKRKQVISLTNFIADSEAGIDEYTLQAFDIQQQALESEPITDLWQRTQKTETDRDDRMVRGIADLRQSLKNIESQIKKDNLVIIKLQQRQADVDILLQEFQRRDWDSSYSKFPDNMQLDDLVRDLTEGNIGSDQALRQLSKMQRFKYRHSKGGWVNSADILLKELHGSIRLPNPRNSRGGFGGFGGGFRGGGGFGGGSFKSGGGF